MNTQKNAAYDLSRFTIVPVSMEDSHVLDAVMTEIDPRVGGRTAHINVNLQEASDVVNRAITDIRADKALYSQIKLLASGGIVEFALIMRLNRNATALWFAAFHDKLEREADTFVLSPEELTHANTLRVELLELALHYHRKDPLEGPRLRAITHENDHLKLANDLYYLTELISRDEKRLRNDPNYRATDVRDARALSVRIRANKADREITGMRWRDRAAVLWTDLQKDYAELSKMVHFLLRATPDRAEKTVPTLVRGGGKRKSANDTENVPDTRKPEPADEEAAAPTKPVATEIAAPLVAAPTSVAAPAKATSTAASKRGSTKKKSR
jgi:hypothetical protein